jgi:hypothetical protein
MNIFLNFLLLLTASTRLVSTTRDSRVVDMASPSTNFPLQPDQPLGNVDLPHSQLDTLGRDDNEKMNVDLAVGMVKREEEGGENILSEKNRGGARGPVRGRKKKGVVFAHSHNDEMQKEPFVSRPC